MKKAITTIAAIGLTTIMSWAAAQPLKIGFVDIRQALQESAPAKAASARLEGEFGGRSRELAQMQTRLKDAGEKLEKESPALSEDERNRRARDLAGARRELERKSREFQEDAERRQQEEQRTVKDRFDRAVKQVADAGKYDLILQDSVIFHSPATDVTRQVIDAMGAQK